MVNDKKEVICDCCGTKNEPAKILSSKKSFFGNKLSDVLHAITQQTVPPSLAIQVCFICFFKFVQCERTILEIRQFVEKKEKTANPEAEEHPEKEEDEVPKKNQIPLKKRRFSMPGQLESPAPTKTSPSKSTKRAAGKNAAPPEAEENDVVNDILDESVSLMPAKPANDNKKNTSILGIFGLTGDAPVDLVADADSDSEEKGRIPETFECKLCDFKVKYPKKMKQHYIEVHGQQRPRIYFCTMCTKSFGVAKTLKEHAKTVHGVELEKEKSGATARPKTVEKEVQAAAAKKKEEAPTVKKGKKLAAKVQVDAADDDEGVLEAIEEDIEAMEAMHSLKKPQTPLKQKPPTLKLQTPAKLQLEDKDEPESPVLSVFRALNENNKKKKEKEVTNAEYTFAINGSSASTPKPNGQPVASPSIDVLICSICETEQPSVKMMQRHMSEFHGIDKPKIFKCHKCDKSLASKQSLNYHLSWHLTNPDAADGAASKRKILHEEGPSSKKRNKSAPTKEVEEEGTNEVAVEKSKKLSLTSSPAKKSKKLSESCNDVADGPSMTSSAVKKNKKLSESCNEVAVSSPVKKSKKLSQSFNDAALPSPKKGQKEPTLVSLLSDEEKWTPPRPKKTKNKERKESESVGILNGNESLAYPLDELAEVNPKVQPHKREMLASICESSIADDESDFNCSQCPKSAKSQRRLESHIYKVHGKSLKCSSCYKKFSTRQSYVVHFIDCDSESMPCGVRKCTKIFQTVPFLEEHLKRRHQW